MTDEILKDEILTDEQLDQIAGGTCSENRQDILIFCLIDNKEMFNF